MNSRQKEQKKKRRERKVKLKLAKRRERKAKQEAQNEEFERAAKELGALIKAEYVELSDPLVSDPATCSPEPEKS